MRLLNYIYICYVYNTNQYDTFQQKSPTKTVTSDVILCTHTHMFYICYFLNNRTRFRNKAVCNTLQQSTTHCNKVQHTTKPYKNGYFRCVRLYHCVHIFCPHIHATIRHSPAKEPYKNGYIRCFYMFSYVHMFNLNIYILQSDTLLQKNPMKTVKPDAFVCDHMYICYIYIYIKQ